MAFGEAPRGIDDMRVYPVTGATNTVGTGVDVPGIRTVSFNTESDSDELEGDNKIIATARGIKRFTGSIELGLINLASLAVMQGGTVTTSGTTPSQTASLDELDDLVSRYFQAIISCPSMDTSGAGYQVTLKKLMITSGMDESHTVNDWTTPGLDFTGVSISGIFATRKLFETNVAITP